MKKSPGKDGITNEMIHHLRDHVKQKLPDIFNQSWNIGKNRNTEVQITLLKQNIEDGFQQKMRTLAVFVDLSKAFDRVWKECILFKLLQKKVCGKMFFWIRSYLFNRTARVKLEG
ncbi:uncharacterized protein LOC143298654 [Babylonia areolata]|uniref:uncharacterized protein LOC143298654 n=1 Tax=Babylonia areolata TaxID=304850 RepID=UPI003FD066FA